MAFDKWFARKADDTAYVCFEAKELVAFLYLKVEGPELLLADQIPFGHLHAAVSE